MNRVIVLAMHGVPPTDFPQNEVAELFRLDAQLGHRCQGVSEALKNRYRELDEKVCSWPRTEENDPYYMWSKRLAASLKKATGSSVLVGFNEFCAPSLEQAIGEALTYNTDEVVVVSTMMTRGGEHSEKDIPLAIQRIRNRYPKSKIVYAWPFEVDEVARFFADHLAHFQ